MRLKQQDEHFCDDRNLAITLERLRVNAQWLRQFARRLKDGHYIELNEIFSVKIGLHRVSGGPVILIGEHFYPFFVDQFPCIPNPWPRLILYFTPEPGAGRQTHAFAVTRSCPTALSCHAPFRGILRGRLGSYKIK
jgi:hypothetical protein